MSITFSFNAGYARRLYILASFPRSNPKNEGLRAALSVTVLSNEVVLIRAKSE
jgi:hypothetical protein